MNWIGSTTNQVAYNKKDFHARKIQETYKEQNFLLQQLQIQSDIKFTMTYQVLG